MTLEILLGPIASGKSTYALKRAKEGALIANDDSIVTSVHGGDYGQYEKRLKALYKGIRSQIIHHAAATGRDVVVDSTGLTRERRLGLIATAHSLDMEVALITFRNAVFCGLEDGERRWKADGRGHDKHYWVSVALSHAKQYEEPTPLELLQYSYVKDIEWV